MENLFKGCGQSLVLIEKFIFYIQVSGLIENLEIQFFLLNRSLN